MPAKRKRRSSKPPKKIPQGVVADKNDFYDTEDENFGVPVSLRIMKELDVMPLEEDPYFDNYSPEEILSRSKIKKAGQGHSKSSPPKKTENLSNDNFVLFRKAPCPEIKEFSPFSKISDEVILHIFHLLPKPTLVKCSAVCKRWRDLSYEETFWRRYDFGRRLVKPCVLEILMSRGVNTLRLAMSEIKSPIFSDTFNQDSTWCSKLLYLDLSMATIEASAVADILSVCRHLVKLSVENCILNEDCCRNIAQNTELTVLNMSMCSGFTSNGLYLLSTQCTKLIEWNLAWTNLTIECMDAFLPVIPTGLKRLNLSGHRKSLDDHGLIDVITRCRDLIELDISDSPLLTLDSFEVLISTCSNLEHLHLSRCHGIPTNSLGYLKNMTNLKNVELFKTLKEEAFTALLEKMPDIQINKNIFSTIARPTTGIRRTSIWGLRVRD